MENNYKSFGKIIPFPKLKPPSLPQANPPDLKTPNSQTLDELIKDFSSIMKRGQYDFYKEWLIPELKSNAFAPYDLILLIGIFSTNAS